MFFVVEEIEQIMTDKGFVLRSHVPKVVNQVAHMIAWNALCFSGFNSLMESGPEWLVSLMEDDLCKIVA